MTFLALSGSLGASHPNPLTKSWNFIFSSLLGISHYVSAMPQENRERIKHRGSDSQLWNHNSSGQRDGFSSQNFKCLLSHSCSYHHHGVRGAGGRRKGKKKWGFLSNPSGSVASLSAPKTCNRGFQFTFEVHFCFWLPLSPFWMILEEEKHWTHHVLELWILFFLSATIYLSDMSDSCSMHLAWETGWGVPSPLIICVTLGKLHNLHTSFVILSSG